MKLATSDNAEFAAVASAVASIRHLVGKLSSIHVFTNSENAMKRFADTSLHSVVHQSETVLDILYPWWEENLDTFVVLHHVPDSVGFQEHNLVHMHVTAIWAEAGSALVQTYDFAHRAITAKMLSFWKRLAQIKKFIGTSFYQLQIGPKLGMLSLSHIKDRPWLSRTGGSNFSTVRMAHALTSHAPIGSYRAQFKLGPEECSCPGSPPKTFVHVYMHCPLYVWEGVAKHQAKADSVLHFLEFLNGNLAAFAFPDSVALSLSEGSSRRKSRRKRGVPLDDSSSGNTQTAGTPAKGPNPPPPPAALPLGRHNVDRVSRNLRYAGVYTTVLNYTRTTRPQARASSLECARCIFFFK